MSEPSAQSDISLLFAKDPLSLTKEDRSEIIKYYRDRRAIFIAGGQKPIRETKTKASKDVVGLDLDLEL